jgi:coenzyme F420-reducing hydrogenase alpha subunit
MAPDLGTEPALWALLNKGIALARLDAEDVMGGPAARELVQSAGQELGLAAATATCGCGSATLEGTAAQ